ncbi:hypothetical protein BDW68DRAFT_172396 [Aspergillus falconensis]
MDAKAKPLAGSEASSSLSPEHTTLARTPPEQQSGTETSRQPPQAPQAMHIPRASSPERTTPQPMKLPPKRLLDT